MLRRILGGIVGLDCRLAPGVAFAYGTHAVFLALPTGWVGESRVVVWPASGLLRSVGPAELDQRAGLQE